MALAGFEPFSHVSEDCDFGVGMLQASQTLMIGLTVEFTVSVARCMVRRQVLTRRLETTLLQRGQETTSYSHIYLMYH